MSEKEDGQPPIGGGIPRRGYGPSGGKLLPKTPLRPLPLSEPAKIVALMLSSSQPLICTRRWDRALPIWSVGDNEVTPAAVRKLIVTGAIVPRDLGLPGLSEPVEPQSYQPAPPAPLVPSRALAARAWRLKRR